MELVKLTTRPSCYQTLATISYAGNKIGFAYDLSSHELYLFKETFTRTTWYIIHMMAD